MEGSEIPESFKKAVGNSETLWELRKGSRRLGNALVDSKRLWEAQKRSGTFKRIWEAQKSLGAFKRLWELHLLVEENP